MNARQLIIIRVGMKWRKHPFGPLSFSWLVGDYGTFVYNSFPPHIDPEYVKAPTLPTTSQPSLSLSLSLSLWHSSWIFLCIGFFVFLIFFKRCWGFSVLCSGLCFSLCSLDTHTHTPKQRHREHEFLLLHRKINQNIWDQWL